MKEKIAYLTMRNHPQLREFVLVDELPNKMYARLRKFGYEWNGRKWTKVSNSCINESGKICMAKN